MRWTFLLMATALALGAPALAASPDDAVDGHPGITYAKLLRQIAPDLAKDDNNVWTLSGIKNFRGLAPSKNPLSEEISFSDLTVLHVREDGHKRIVLFSGDAAGDSGFDTLLAAFDDEAKTPKLLDYRNVGGDRFNNAGDLKPLSASTDFFVVHSWHDNSSQSYDLETPLFLHDRKFQSVTTLFAFGNAFCRYKETQSPAYRTNPQPKLPYYALTISVTIEVTYNEGADQCGDESKPPPKAGKRIVSDTYRWNGKAFVPVSKAIENLSDRNWKLNNE